jgi:hypothetical protein
MDLKEKKENTQALLILEEIGHETLEKVKKEFYGNILNKTKYFSENFSSEIIE